MNRTLYALTSAALLSALLSGYGGGATNPAPPAVQTSFKQPSFVEGTVTEPLVLNGNISSEKAISMNGKTYVPLSSLTSLGIKVSSASGTVSLTSSAAIPAGNSSSSGAGGANQKASVTGCQNEWLFNGIWRMRVTKMEAATNPSRGNLPGYKVTVQISNGTTQTLTLDQTGIQFGNAYTVNFADGNSYAAPTSTNVAFLDKTTARILQGASTLLEFGFWPDDGRTLEQARTNLPQKFLLEVDPKKLKKDLKVGFTVPDPSFRVDLTCKK